MTDSKDCNFPKESLLASQLDSYEYADSFSIQLKRQGVKPWELIYALSFAAPPWVMVLSKFRDKLVGGLGLKTGASDPTSVQPPYHIGQQIGFFKFFEQSSNEVILGDDDVHLDFRTSLFTMLDDNGSTLRVSTLVKTKNRVGSVYFFIIKPFHKLIVSIVVRRMGRLIDNREIPLKYYENSLDI